MAAKTIAQLQEIKTFNKGDLTFFRQLDGIERKTTLENFLKYAKEIVLDNSMDLFIGTVHQFSHKNYDKTRFLLCNGQKVKKVDYPKLYAKIGDLYAKDNSVAPTQDEFVIPNYVDEFLRGGTESNLGTKQQDAMQKITGKAGAFQFSNQGLTNEGSMYTSYVTGGTTGGSSSSENKSFVHIDTSRQVRTDTETRPRNRKVLYAILAK